MVQRPSSNASSPRSGPAAGTNTADVTPAHGNVPRWLLLWAAGALALLFLALSVTPLTNNDIWLHMANGRWILDNGQVPLLDPYSFSAAGHRFHAHEWLAGVIFHLVHLLAGVTGLILFKTLLGAMAVAISLATARRLGAQPAALALTALVGLAIVNSRFLERPEMFSFAFTAIYIWVLNREHGESEARAQDAPQGAAATPWIAFLRASHLWWLVPIQWAWVQIHGYFLTGLALVGTFLAAETIRAWRRRGEDRTFPGRRLISGWTALAVMTLLGLVNPNGVEIYIFPFRLAGGDNEFMRTIFEWKPTFVTSIMTRSSMFLAFCLWLALLCVASLDVPALLRRLKVWRGIAVAGLVSLLALRPLLERDLTLPAAWVGIRTGRPLPVPPVHPGTGLAEAAWLWSPADLLASMTGLSGIQAGLDSVLSPLRVVGAWGDDFFTLLWLALVVWLVATWRRPVPAALAVITLALAILFLQAGTWASGILGLTVLPALAWSCWRGRIPLWQLLTSMVFLVLAVRQNRNIVNFALVTLPLLAPALSRLRDALPAAAAGRRQRSLLIWPAVATTLLLALTLSAGWPYTPRVSKRFGLGVGDRIPTEAVDYIRTSGLRGQVFNKYAYGAYLIHELYPDTRVFMDSRNGVYGEELYRLYLNSLRDAGVTARVFTRYRFDYVLVDYKFYPDKSPDQGLLSYLRRQPEWILVEFNDQSLVYARDQAGHEGLIRRDGYDILDPAAFQPGELRNSDAGTRDAFARESRRAFARHPHLRSTRLLMAESELTAGRSERALDLFEEVLTDHPDDVFALVAAARVASHLNQFGRARMHYLRVLELRPALDDLRQELQRLPPGDA
jgi:hypothetical protein